MSEAFALPTNSAPAPVNSVIASFLIGSSWFRLNTALCLKSLALPFVPEISEKVNCVRDGTTGSAANKWCNWCNRLEQRTPWGSYFSVLRPTPGEDHEGTFVYYYCYWLDARHWRIRPITERATQNQFTPRCSKSHQFKFVGPGGGVAEFYAVCPECPIDVFRNTEIGDHYQPVSPDHDGQ